MGYFDYVGGGRRSDPLKSKDAAPALAPDWQLNRVVSAQDVAPFTGQRASKGLNASHYEAIRFMVVPMDADPTINPSAAPGGAANPNVEVMVWSEQANTFVSLPTPITATGGGAGVAYMVDVPDANGSIIACMVTNAPGGVVAISAQGYDRNPGH